MSRNNRKNAMRRRAYYTGETHQQVRRAILQSAGGPPWIPDASTAAQQLVESAVLHRLVQGARAQWPDGRRPKHPLFLESVSPSAEGLGLVVPMGDARRFGLALAGGLVDGVRPPVDEITIRPVGGNNLHLNVPGAGLVDLCCAWSELRHSVGVVHGAAVSPREVHLGAHAGGGMAENERAVLSGLLRRIALFAHDPGALEWLFRWHQWLMLGHLGVQPRLPQDLVRHLTAEGFGLGLASCRVLGIDGPPHARTVASPETQPEPASASFSKTPVAPPVPPAAVAAPDTDDGHGEQPEPASGVYQHLAVAALRLDPDAPVLRPYYAIKLPERWKALLQQLETGVSSQRKNIRSIAGLNEAITAVIPDCVVVHPWDTGNAEDWLLAWHPVSTELIFRLVVAWIQSQKAPEDQIRSTLEQLHPSDLTWEQIQITANLPSDRLARLITMDVADRLSRHNVPVPFENLNFVRCSSARGAQVMSWPPQMTDSMAFSVTIAISVQTTPFTGAPTVHLNFGIRRWMPVRGKLTIGGAHLVYLNVAQSLLDGQVDARHFGTANVNLIHSSRKPGDPKSWRPQWSPALTSVLDRAGLLHLLPDAEELVANPTRWLEDPHPAALPYVAGMLAWTKVSSGLPVIDRVGLMDWAIGELAPHMRPIPPLPRVAARVYPGLTRIAGTTITGDALADVVGPRLTVELLIQTEAGLQHALSGLGQLLGAEFPATGELRHSPQVVDMGPVIVTVRPMPLPDASPERVLDRPGTAAKANAYAQHITRGLDPTAHPTVTLVETAFDHVAGTHRSDLGAALRVALATTGRLSGIVAPAMSQDADSAARRRQSDADPARFARAIGDLFRQLGVRPVPLPPPAPRTVACNPAVLAIWMIGQRDRGTRRVRQPVPLAVLIDPTGQHIQIRTPWFAWQPLHIGLLTLAEHNAADTDSWSASAPLRFIQEVIEHAVAEHSDTLLLTHAQNLRHAWPHLRNDNLHMDTIDLGDGLQPINTLPGLRHVRVRTSQSGETPQCHGFNDKTVGQPKGLWRYPEPRLYASTTGKPAIAAESRLHNSKLTDGHRYGKTTKVNTGAQVWDEQLLELAVAGLQYGDRPEHWAALVHNLRDAAPYINWSTSLPLPLHLAEQIEDYLPTP